MVTDRHVPEGWRLVRLGNVAEVNPKRPKLDVKEHTQVTFIPMAAVATNCAGIMSPEQREYHEVASGYTYFEENDVLFAKITPCLQNGKHALASDLTSGFGFGTTEFHVVRASSSISPSHLFRVLTQPYNIEKCEKNFSGTAGQQRVQPEALKSIPILLPPLSEQRDIAAVLDSIDEAIERTESVITATEHLRESLLHELLTRGVPGLHTEWKEVRGIGTIPADWEVVRLGDVIQTSTYGTNTRLGSSGEVPILRMNNIQGGELDLSDVRWADLTDSEKGHLNLVPGDILFNRTNSLELVGKIAIVRDLPQPISFASYLVRLRVREDLVNPLWLSVLLWSGSCQSRIRRFATPGVSQANINPTSLKSLTIQLPSLAEQEATAAMSDGVGEAIDRARTEKDMLDILKASVVDALLTGRVRVSV